MNQQDAQILVTSLYFRMLDMFRTVLFHLQVTLFIYINVSPEDGLESPKHAEHPKIKTSYKNLCILLVHFHITNDKHQCLTQNRVYPWWVVPVLIVDEHQQNRNVFWKWSHISVINIAVFQAISVVLNSTGMWAFGCEVTNKSAKKFTQCWSAVSCWLLVLIRISEVFVWRNTA